MTLPSATPWSALIAPKMKFYYANGLFWVRIWSLFQRLGTFGFSFLSSKIAIFDSGHFQSSFLVIGLGWADFRKIARTDRSHLSLAGGTQPKGFGPKNSALSPCAILRQPIKDSGYDATIRNPVECSVCSKIEILLCKWTILSSNIILEINLERVSKIFQFYEFLEFRSFPIA